MAGKQDKISNACQESCSLFSYSIAKVLLYVFVQVAVLAYSGYSKTAKSSLPKNTLSSLLCAESKPTNIIQLPKLVDLDI